MKAVYTILLLLCTTVVLGATIQGNTYDFNLEIAENSIVELISIDNPDIIQKMVAKDGQFLFEASNGKYFLTAKSGIIGASETIVIQEYGTYNFDLILFDSFQDFDEILLEIEEEFDTTVEIEEDIETWKIVLGVLIFIVIVIILRHLFFRKPKPTRAPVEDKTKREVTEFIRKEEGRTTQKAIRKQFSWSEAKISLVLSELEHEGRIKKIKKGRGNLIILNESYINCRH